MPKKFAIINSKLTKRLMEKIYFEKHPNSVMEVYRIEIVVCNFLANLFVLLKHHRYQCHGELRGF